MEFHLVWTKDNRAMKKLKFIHCSLCKYAHNVSVYPVFWGRALDMEN